MQNDERSNTKNTKDTKVRRRSNRVEQGPVGERQRLEPDASLRVLRVLRVKPSPAGTAATLAEEAEEFFVALEGREALIASGFACVARIQFQRPGDVA